MPSRYSPYIDLDAIQDRPSFDRLLRHVQRVQPAYMTVFNAMLWDQSESYITELLNASPTSKIIWRAYPQDSVEDAGYYVRAVESGKTAPQAAGEWVAMRLGRWLPFVRRHGLIIKLLNEAAPVFNAPFETEVIRQLGEQGIRCAAMAWATGTPDLGEYRSLAIADCIRTASKFDAVVNCHEYGSLDPTNENDLVNRFTRITALYRSMGLPLPTVVIGEFGLVGFKNVNGVMFADAEAGWKRMGVSDQAYFGYMKRSDASWYRPRNVCWTVFRWGEKGRFVDFNISRSEILLEMLEDEARKDFAMTTIEWHVGKTIPNSGVNLRKTPGGELIVTIPKDTEVLWRESENDSWYHVFWQKTPTETYEGYSSVALITTVPPIPDPPPEPPPPPPVPVEPWLTKLTTADRARLYELLRSIHLRILSITAHQQFVVAHIQLSAQMQTNLLTEVNAAWALLDKVYQNDSEWIARKTALEAKIAAANTLEDWNAVIALLNP